MRRVLVECEAGTALSGIPEPLAERRAGIVSERLAALHSLEGVRLQLVRRRSGLGTPEEVEAELSR